MVVGPTRDSGLESGPESINHLGIERAHNSINLHSVVGVLGAPQVSWGHHHDRWMLLFFALGQCAHRAQGHAAYSRGL